MQVRTNPRGRGPEYSKELADRLVEVSRVAVDNIRQVSFAACHPTPPAQPPPKPHPAPTTPRAPPAPHVQLHSLVDALPSYEVADLYATALHAEVSLTCHTFCPTSGMSPSAKSFQPLATSTSATSSKEEPTVGVPAAFVKEVVEGTPTEFGEAAVVGRLAASVGEAGVDAPKFKQADEWAKGLVEQTPSHPDPFPPVPSLDSSWALRGVKWLFLLLPAALLLSAFALEEIGTFSHPSPTDCSRADASHLILPCPAPPCPAPPYPIPVELNPTRLTHPRPLQPTASNP